MKIAGGKKRKAGRSLGPKRRKVGGFANAAFKSPAAQKGSTTEKKWVDVNYTTSHMDNVGNFNLLNGLAKGTDVYNRIGRRIKMIRLNIRGYLFWNNNGAVPGADMMRAFLVYDREPNAAAPVIGDVLQGTDATGATSSSSIAHMNLNNADRFLILKEWLFSQSAATNLIAAGPNGPQAVPTMTELPFKYSKKLNLDVRYNAGTAGTIADITTGALYFVTYGIQTNANHQYDVAFSSRVRFTDS